MSDEIHTDTYNIDVPIRLWVTRSSGKNTTMRVFVAADSAPVLEVTYNEDEATDEKLVATMINGLSSNTRKYFTNLNFRLQNPGLAKVADQLRGH